MAYYGDSVGDSPGSTVMKMNDLDWGVQYDTGQSPALLQGAGLECELKRFDSLFNARGDKFRLPMGTSHIINHERDDSASSALVLTKHWNKDKELDFTELEIKSPYIKAALKAVVPQYKDFQIQVKHIVIRNEPQCIFHFREEIQRYGCQLQDSQAAKHVLFLLQYMWRELSTEMFTFFSTLGSSDGPATIDFAGLWMAFRPGDLIFLKPATAVDDDRVLRFKSMDRCRCSLSFCPRDKWTIEGTFIDYDGTKYGHDTMSVDIKKYEGCRSLQELAAFPLRYHDRNNEIRSRLIARGQKFCGLHGMHHRRYDGVAELLGDDRNVSMHGEDDYFPSRSTLVNGRIIVDAFAFEEARPAHSICFASLEKTFEAEKGQKLELSDDEYIICTSTISGFSLNERKWGNFKIDLIQPLEFNESAFHSLILDEHYKKQILSLVKFHSEERVKFDDFIQGKGKGMVFLLHGAPGVGKTLTAESVADFCERPLLRLDASCLGTTATEVEASLSSIFRFATKWRAVALLDEADVFLEQRQTNNLKHNALVSVFLRALEYYEGILFLTTNRVDSFDTAFKSRIHLAIKYPELDAASRRKLWYNFLSQTSAETAEYFDRSGMLDELKKVPLNGRQIKNIVRTAFTLAVSDGMAIQISHIRSALQPLKDFDADVEKSKLERKRMADTEEPEPDRLSKRVRGDTFR
ncbi:p-loop containing nucleoside triphosphate hydrolase [Rhypophila decipiens]|uniref:P-loop containing nucleoside triphosphate hydrolase n=1 Tax=Rhypophila decipiens TaxID=261697 RepID=A0AAN6Y005_9PEZI|nr:p-loop containing nucleoside triphosphate hydrolase [Rhypophila decipiens]